MAQVTVTINGRKYDIACDNGEEDHLTKLGELVNKRVNELAKNVGQVGDTRLLVMASILFADELSEVYTELDEIRDQGKVELNDKLSLPEFKSIASRIEKVAEKLEDY